MKILLLNKEEMKKVCSMGEAIEADKVALAEYSDGKADIPLRVNIDVPEHEGQSLYMPGYAPKSKALGVKIVSVYPNNIEKGITSVPSTMVVVDEVTGQVCSLMDGTFLTQLRTGAVSGAATDLLSRKNSKKFVLIGTGGQAESQLEAVLSVRDIEDVAVSDQNIDRAKDFAKRMTEKFGKDGLTIRASEDLEKDLKEADILTTVTTAKNPVFDASLLKEGVHINGVGSYTPQMSEVDPKLFERTKLIYVDSPDAIAESGDLIKPIESGDLKKEDIQGELGELILGNIKGRESDSDITFFETTGNAVLDIVVAKKIYENAIEKKIGNYIDL